MGHKLDTVDGRIDEIASRQHGVATLAQLEEAGLSRYAVAKRAKAGRLHRIHRGVYAIGHRGLSLYGRFMAAVLACGEGAALSHVSAAVLWELLRPIDGPVHITVPSTSGRSKRRGIHLHRSPSLKPLGDPSPSPSYLQQEGERGRRVLTTYRHNIPVTSVARTIEDLRASTLLPPHLLRRATRQDRAQGLSPRPHHHRPHPLRPRDPLPRPCSSLPPPASRGQRQARPLDRRLPLARPARRRRDRLLRLPPRIRRLRGRSRP